MASSVGGDDWSSEILEHGEALLEVDAQYRVLRVNAAQERISGRPRTQTVGKTLWEIWPGLEATGFGRAYRRCLEERVRIEFVEFFPPLDLWTLVTVFPLSHGGFAVMFRDISEQRRSELQRDQLASRLQLALDAEKMAWWTYDPIAQVATFDQRFREMFWLGNLSAGIDVFRKLFHPDDADRVFKAIDASIDPANPVPYEVEYRIRREDGLERWISAHGLGTFEGDGPERRATLLVGTASDITERKSRELALQQAKNAIERQLEEQRRVEAELRASEARTKEALGSLEKALEQTRKTEVRLRQAHKMEAIGQLAGGIAHDFNNLLTVILSGAELLLEELRDGEPLKEEALEIKRAGERAAGLTRQLLAFSRRQVMEPRTVDVNTLLSGLDKLLKRLLGEDLELALLLDPHVHRCRLDPGQFEQVVVNLAVNARDAMPDGGRLTIETANVTLDAAYVEGHPDARIGRHVRVAVSDTGVGMSRDVQARIFEPFYTTKEMGRGTGLGLSMVYGIVRQSGGHIWVYSEPGQGTTFRMYFPISDGELEAVAVSPPPPAQVRGKETVLLVEDDEQVRAAVNGMLRRAGYHVITAANGGEALLTCEQHGGTIHLLLTDVVMPKLNGRKLAERLLQTRPAMRVLFMSGYTENAIVHHGVLDAGLDFIAKPISTEELLQKVRELLDR